MRIVDEFGVGDARGIYASRHWKAPFIIVPGLLILIGWLLIGCSRSPEVQTDLPIDNQQPVIQDDTQVKSQNLERVDRQGSVEVAVIPAGFDMDSDGMLSFEISMNTHSVDLSIDLAKLSTLATDHGVILSASSWSGGNGHHVGGILSFPVRAADGSPIVSGAQKLTLTIRDVDVPERLFVWELPQTQ